MVKEKNMKNYNYTALDSDLKSAIHCLENNIAVPKHLTYLIGNTNKQAGLLSEDDKRGAIAKLIDGFKINWKYQLGNKINDLNKSITKIDSILEKIKNAELTEDIDITEDTDLLWTTIYIQGKTCNFKSYSEILDSISNANFKWDLFYETFKNINIKHKDIDDKYEDGSMTDGAYDSAMLSLKKEMDSGISKIKNNSSLDKNILDGMDKHRRDFQESLFILKEDLEWILPVLISHDEMIYINDYDASSFFIDLETEIYISPEDVNLKSAVTKMNQKELEDIKKKAIDCCITYKKVIKSAESELGSLYNDSDILKSIENKDYNSQEIIDILYNYLRFVKFPAVMLSSFYYQIIRSYEK